MRISRNATQNCYSGLLKSPRPLHFFKNKNSQLFDNHKKSILKSKFECYDTGRETHYNNQIFSSMNQLILYLSFVVHYNSSTFLSIRGNPKSLNR